MPSLALRRIFIILLAALLSACAYAPGMYIGQNSGAGRPSSWFSSGSATAPTADVPPPGRIITITPKLIQTLRAEKPADLTPAIKQLFAQAQTYRVGPGDVLNIIVWDHPELVMPAAGGLASDAGSLSPVGNGYNVNLDGLIQFPYAGTLKVSGLTEFDVRDMLSKRLSKFIKDPQVTVRIQSFRSGRIYLDGEVRNPGLQFLNDIPMTLPDALGRAGGFTALADRSAIAVTRAGLTTRIDLPQLTAQGINPSSILLKHGDLVRVLGREESKVFVLGEVSRPSTLTLRDGHLSLNEALNEAGGVNQSSGDPRQIFVVRAARSAEPEIYHLDARTPSAFALAEGFALQARDVIYVDPVPLVRWNRVISLVLPSAQAVSTTRSTLN